MINEVFITRTVTKEILVEDNSLSVEKESNQIAFISGIVVTLLVAGIAVLIAILCMKYRSRASTDKIVLRSQASDVQAGLGVVIPPTGGEQNDIVA